jgi:transcriptional regulator with XRE-family HTH domain
MSIVEPQPAPTGTDPEIATTPFWRQLMAQRMEELQYSQTSLARRIGAQQSAISLILSGSTTQSRLVMPICNVLKIAPPHILVRDEIEQRWIEAGRRLREVAESIFMRQLVRVVEDADDFERERARAEGEPSHQ